MCGFSPLAAELLHLPQRAGARAGEGTGVRVFAVPTRPMLVYEAARLSGHWSPLILILVLCAALGLFMSCSLKTVPWNPVS